MSAPAAPSLDHLRLFAAVVDAGGFTAAANVTGRSQPVISYAVATLEAQLGVALFARGRRRPVLTPAGETILAYARRISLLGDELRASAAGLTQGLEGMLVVAVDSFFPTAALAAALRDLATLHPSVSPNIHIGARDHVLDLVVTGEAMLGASAFDVAWPPGIEAVDFGRIAIIAVAAPGHMLARAPHGIPTAVLRDSIQITNKPAGIEDEARDVAMNSTRPWRVDDLATQVALLREGIGWGYLPRHVADAEIAAGRLAQLFPASRAEGIQPWSLVHRSAAPPGPAGRYLAERLRHRLAAIGNVDRNDSIPPA